MKIIVTLFSALLLSILSVAQCDTSRYTQAVFSEITVMEDVEYGTAPRWNWPYFSETLTMDIYLPVGDTLNSRPCMIWAHSGAFINGSNDVDDMVALCDSFARRGYVTASINYRKGFNPLDGESAERAVYRGLQDGRAAFRYLLEHADFLEIDPSKIFIGGSSAGSFISHHVSFLDEDERPGSSYQQFLAPDLGCIDCTGNDFDHDVEPIGNIGLWGAIGDTSWIDSNVPTLMVHGTGDGVVPYTFGPPFGFPILPDVYGSNLIHTKLQNEGYDSQLETVNMAGHEPHGTDNGTWSGAPDAYWYNMFDVIEDFSFQLIRPASQDINGLPTFCDTTDVQYYSVILNPGERVCWESTNGILEEISANEISLSLDEGEATLTAIIYNSINAHSTVSEFTVTFETCIEDISDCSLADYNNSGIVDAGDLTIFLTDWGCEIDCNTDLDGNDTVNASDLTLFLSVFGLNCDLPPAE